MTTSLSTLNASAPTTMSTREIAELTGKLHTNVIRDFRQVCEALEINQLSFESVYLAGNGEHRVEYLLPKDLTNTLVSGYSIPMRHAIVKRWMALEAQQASTHHIPSSYREAMLLALENHEKLEAANLRIAADAPKVSVYEAVVADKETTLQTFVRMLEGVNSKTIILVSGG